MGILDDDLEGILSDPTVDRKSRDLARQVRGMEDKVRRAGLDPQDATPRESFFSQLLDTLDAPRQGVAGVIDTLLRGDMFQDGVGTGFRRGQQENTTASDIFRRHDIIDNPIARGVAGFAADVLTDPLTYLSLGTGTAAKVGGKTLSEAGQALRGQAVSRLLDNGVVDILEQDNKLNQAFAAAGKYEEAAKNFNKAKTPSVKALEADRMSKAEDGFRGVLSPEDIVGKGIFEKNKLRIGANIPFLGHLTNEKQLAEEVILKDIGPVGQALRLAGKVLKPGKLKIADLELSDEMIDLIQTQKAYANNKLVELGDKIGQLKDVPVLGTGIKGAEAVGKRAKDTFTAANNLFKKIFYQKGLVGAAANNNRLDYQNFKEAAKVLSKDRAYNALGEDLIKDKNLQKEVYLAIDAQAMDAIRESVGENKDVLNAVNKIRTTEDVREGDQLILRNALTNSGAEDNFRVRIDNLLADPNVTPQVKDGIVRTFRAMDDIALEEAGNGLGYSRLEYYVPHKYLNVNNAEKQFAKSSGRAEAFTKSRKYDTIAEAFSTSGKVGDTDLASLLQYRIEKSLTLQAQRNYFKRLAIEEGLAPHLVQAVYKDALQNPVGEAAAALQRYRITLPDVDLALQEQGLVNAARQRVYAGVGLKDPKASELVAQSASDFQNKIHQELWAAGQKPLDNLLPQEALSELGQKVRIPGGKEEIFLPKPIADSFNETIAARDILKDAAGKSAFGKAALKVLDHTSSFFKKMVTLPFPAYWAQNYLGDRFNQAMQGIHAVNPGIFARTHSLLSGKSAIKSATGQLLDKPTMDRIIKQFGMQYTVSDFLGTKEAFGDMDIDRFLAMKNSLGSNILKGFKLGNGANREAALAQLHDKFQKSFDGFYRVNHFVHRFEQGDSIADAVRGANDAYFNYRDLSPVEQSLFRRFYMFYGYMSKATKQTLTNLVTNPGNLTLQLHGVNGLAEIFSDPNAAPTAEMHDAKLLQSAVSNEQLSRVVGRTKDGKPIRARGFAAPLNAVMQQFSLETPRTLSVKELIDTAADSTVRTLQKQFATSNPIINAAAQKISGKNLYFNKPLDAEFLRKLPSLNAGAEKLLGYKHNELPADLDAPLKYFLNAVPDGQGRLIADPGKFWILMNIVPGLSRATSMAGTLTNAEIPGKTKALRTLAGINIEDGDPTRSYLYDRKNALQDFINANSINRRLQNDEE